jgi:toxin-antitoxin system PIN domain toxin
VILPDVNVLLYAFRSDAPRHGAHREWLGALVNGDEAYAMSPQVLCSVVRIATHPRVYVRPSALADVLAFTGVLLSPPTCTVVHPGSRHWAIFDDLCRRASVTGNLAQDAWYAALAIEAGCEWLTTDRDYARFPGLRWRPPF